MVLLLTVVVLGLMTKAVAQEINVFIIAFQ
ncbi:MAG: hypothetical protein HS132_04190 [Planctomycetia bacterium]|nr:hypothetical protein [Planctomycetia bacterium]